MEMWRVPGAIAAVLAVLYIVPFIFYGVASRFIALPAPEGAGAARFLLGVLVTKVGTAVAFVMLFQFAREAWAGRWLLFAGLWFVMFTFSEIGDAVTRRSTVAEALIGIASEAVYAPLCAWITVSLLFA